MPTDVKKQDLSQSSANRPSIRSTGNCSSFENEVFVRDFLEIPTVEDVKTKFLCET